MSPIDHTIEIREPKGGSGGKGFKSGGYVGGSGGGGSGNGSNLPLWAKLVIIFSVLWAVLYISLFIFFLWKVKKDNLILRQHDKEATQLSSGRAVGYAAWRALKYSTPIGPVVWVVMKIRDRYAARNQGSKKVGGTFYRKIEEEERGVKDVGESTETISPHGPPLPPKSYPLRDN